MDEEVPSQIFENGWLWVPSTDLPIELTLVSFRRDLLLMPSIMLSRFPDLERSRTVRLTGASANYLELTEDEIKLLGTRKVLTVANGGFVYILPNSDRLHEAEGEARAVVERALNPAGYSGSDRQEGSLVVISYASPDRAYADLLAGHMRKCLINAWHYVPFARYGVMLIDPLEHALRSASAVTVLMSPYSSASSAVWNEVNIALVRNLRILPILLGGRPLSILERFAYFDATNGQLPSDKILKESLVSR